MMIGKEREGEQQGAEAVQKRKDGGAGFVEGCVFHLFFFGWNDSSATKTMQMTKKVTLQQTQRWRSYDGGVGVQSEVGKQQDQFW